MTDSKISSTTISTDHLGPCVGFLLHFQRGDQESSYLNHYSFDDDEKDLPLGNVLVLMLNYICDGFKNKLGVNSLKNHSEILVLHLLVASGVKGEADSIKNTLATLNHCPWDIKDLFTDVDDFYL